MFRYLSFGITLLFIWQFIGYGFTYQFTATTIGTIETKEPTIVKKRSYQPTQALLSAQLSEQSYQTLTFVGDILLARNVEYLMRAKGPSYPFDGLNLENFGPDSAIIGNFEAAVPVQHEPTPIGQIDFSVANEFIRPLSAAGFSHLSLANNHSFDFGESDLVHTTEELGGLFEPFGHPQELSQTSVEVIMIDSVRVALIGINGLRSLSRSDIADTLSKASRKSDFQIVYIHWGEEYALRHNQQQRQIAEQLIHFGADVIIGHHPHVVQGVDLIDGVPVFYSLGNYIFDQYFSRDVQEGLVLGINFEAGLNINIIPVTSRYSLSQPQKMNDAEHANFLTQLSNKSHEHLRESIVQGYITIESEFASFDKVAMMQSIHSYAQ